VDDNVCDGALFCDVDGLLGPANTCQNDSASALVCDGEAGSCAESVCDPGAGACVETSVINGLLCNDGDACTTFDNCQDGNCTGIGLICVDGDDCTDDECDENGGCVFPFNTAPCDDGSLCTEADACVNGGCFGEIASCDDGSDCTADFCDPAFGCVAFPLDGAACVDGDECTTSDTCSDGACVGGPLAICDDLNACTADSCDADSGCVNEDISASCDDGNVCTNDACDPAFGCVAINNTDPCSDDDVCTVEDVCAAGACVSGADLDCSDGDVCTDDDCDAADGCLNPFNTAPCDDGDACVSGESCLEGVCGGGVLESSCYPEGAICVVDGLAGDEVVCPLLLARATEDTSLPAALQVNIDYPTSVVSVIAFTDVLCLGPGGGEPCFDQDVPPGTLFPTGHGVSMAPAAIEDWAGLGTLIIANISNPLASISEAYLDENGDVIGDALFLEMHVSLTEDATPAAPVFLTASGVIGSTPASDSMDAEIIDGVIVVSDQAGDCVVNPGQCDDGLACTADSCNGLTGECVHTADDTACDDGVSCSVDLCDLDVGCVSLGDHSACDDGDACTSDECVPAVGCSSVAIEDGGSCEDGDLCTTGDTCLAGSCNGGSPLDCDDGNDCTLDGCDADTGCVSTELNGVACEDGDACTEGDACVAGACEGGTTLSTPECTDGVVTLCSMVGDVGEQVSCPLQLAAVSESSALATGIQLILSYDAATLKLDNFYDESCFPGVGCFETPATGVGAFPLSTGHSVSAAPPDTADWDGFGGVIVTHLSAPSTPITEAYFAVDGTIVGDPDFVEVRFDVLATILPEAPAEVSAGSLLASDAAASTLEMTVVGEGLFMTSEP